MKGHNRIELLAPVGKRDVLEAVISAGADAVYLGGKRHNMRMWRSEFNFGNAELSDAIRYAHGHGVQVYVTVNNLYSEAELEPLRDDLKFLQDSGADGLIVQDLGVAEIHRAMDLTIPLHASVQMNIHNAQSVAALRELGFSRVVMSKNVPLAEMERIGRETGVELEYFLHGDMCFSHTGQCYTSGLLFGESSNRGRCLKPCRWPYELVSLGTPDQRVGPEEKYLLSHKDLCLLPFVPDLIQAGICSLKMEGRMREADYLKPIVAAYRRAIDSYYADPVGFEHSTGDWAALNRGKQREFTSGHAWKNPGAGGLDPRGRESRFLSVPPVVKTLEPDRLPEELFPEPEATAPPERGQLAVMVGSPQAAEAAARNGADLVYVGGESFVNGPHWDSASIERGIRAARDFGSRVVLALPHVTYRREWPAVKHLLSVGAQLGVEGVLVGNLGVLAEARRLGFDVYADFPLNVCNAAAAKLVGSLGAVQVTAEIEIALEELVEFHRSSPVPVECVVHGPVPGMVSDYCLPGAWAAGVTPDDVCPSLCRSDFGLKDPHGQIYPVRVDRSCRNHIYLPYDLGLFPFIPVLLRNGLDRLRIEGQFYDSWMVAEMTGIYRKLMDRVSAAGGQASAPESDWVKLNQLLPRPLGTGAFGHHRRKNAAEG